MDKKEKTEIMMHKFETVMSKYNATEKKARRYGTVDLLYRAEVHTIDAIGKNGKINVTDLARCLGITKGGVSQMIDRLLTKGLVSKKTVPEAENEVCLSLTEKGIRVHKGHQAYHKELYFEISKKLNHLTEKNIDTCFDILDVLENFLDTRDEK